MRRTGCRSDEHRRGGGRRGRGRGRRLPSPSIAVVIGRRPDGDGQRRTGATQDGDPRQRRGRRDGRLRRDRPTGRHEAADGRRHVSASDRP